MYATSASRQRMLPAGRPHRVFPELAIRCKDTGKLKMASNSCVYNTFLVLQGTITNPNESEFSSRVHLSTLDNQTVYFMATNTSRPAQSGLFGVRVATSIGFLQQLPSAVTPSFAFVAPNYLAFRTFNGSDTQLHYHQMGAQIVATVGLDPLDFGFRAGATLIGPITPCQPSEFHWIYASEGIGTLFL
jgi:hypothetical protein